MKNHNTPYINRIMISFLPFLVIACVSTTTKVETVSEPVSSFNVSEPIIQARLGEVRIEKFTKSMKETIKFGRVIDTDEAEKDLENKLQSLLNAPGLFENSASNLLNVKATPLAIEIIEPGFLSYLIEIRVRYEFTPENGGSIFEEVITTQEPGEDFNGPHWAQVDSIRNSITANMSQLLLAIKRELPNALRSYIETQKTIRQQIAANLRKEDRYFRTVTSNAVVRNNPDSKAKEVMRLPQTDLLHITGSLPSGWLQVSHEGNPIGWVHSSLLREDLSVAPSFRPSQRVQVPGLVATPTDQATIDVTSLNFGTYHALLVGNNAYQHLPKLHTAVNDVQALGKLLQGRYGFNVKFLKNGTRADILRSINGYRRTLTNRDNLLIYYAGHGWLDKDADQGYWLPVDAEQNDSTNWISNSSITDALRAMDAKHVLIIADSCYSGKLTRGINIRIRTKNYYQRISGKKARTVMASGGLEPVADEGGKMGHSIFASALIDALNENSGVLDATLLFSKIRRPVMVNADQTPEYSDIRKAGHDGGDFLFIRTNKP